MRMNRTRTTGLIATMMLLLLLLLPTKGKGNGNFSTRRTATGWEFYDTRNGERFTPRGVNYFRTGPRQTAVIKYPPIDLQAEYGDTGSVTFDPGQYDVEATEIALTAMGEAGYNVIRVYYDFTNQPGPDGQRLNPDYLANLADFLQRAQAHGLHAILTGGYLPAAYYDIVESIDDAEYSQSDIEISGQSYPALIRKNVNGFNVALMHEGVINATGQYINDVLDGLAAHDPGLLDAIFAIDIISEPFFIATQKPFSIESGTVTMKFDTKKTYNMDLNDPANDRQALADDATRHWINKIVTAIKDRYPTMLVTVGVFPPYITGRTGYGGVSSQESAWDSRQPLRLSVMNDSKLDYVDLHIFPAPVGIPVYDMAVDLHSTELDQITLKKPLIMGESGMHKKYYPTLDEAIRGAIKHQADSCKYGFSGWVYYPWDGGTEFWNANESDNAMLKVLSPKMRPNPAAIISSVGSFHKYE